MGGLQKKIRRRVSVAHYFRVDPFLLTEEQVDVLYEEIPTMRALQELDTRSANAPLTWQKAYWLVLTATGDEDRADKAGARIMAEEIRRAGRER